MWNLPLLIMSQNCNDLWSLSAFRPPCCFMTSFRRWSASMIFKQKGQVFFVSGSSSSLSWCLSRWVLSLPFSERWVISCQSSYRNYTWCLSSLSLFLFRPTACATSKSYLILSTHWLTFPQKSPGIADGLCLPKAEACVWMVRVSVYYCEKMRKGFFMLAVRKSLSESRPVNGSIGIKYTTTVPSPSATRHNTVTNTVTER